MTTVTEPFSPLLQLSRDIDRLLGRNGGLVGYGYTPPADVLVTDEAVSVMMDVPGLRVDDLEIELADDVLTVRGERRVPYSSDGESRAWQQLERGFGRFERSLQVPRGLDPNAIEASLDAGVLTLRIPKPERLKPRRVEIAGKARGDARQLEGQSV